MLSKRRHSLDPNQLAFTFDLVEAPTEPGQLQDIEKRTAAGVALALKDDRRSRQAIAEAMSFLLSKAVSKAMLDAYAAEGREAHNISFVRMLTLLAVADRVDILDDILSLFGFRALRGDEVDALRLGHLNAQMASLKREIRALEKTARPVGRADLWGCEK